MSRNLSKLPFEIEKSVEESTSLRKDLEQLKQEQEKKKEYKDHPAQLKVLLKHIEHGITKLPVFCTKKERLAVYAAQVTGDPHFFDSNTFAELLLFDFITYHFHTIMRKVYWKVTNYKGGKV